MSSIDRLFHFGTWVPEVWRNTIQRKEHEKDFELALAEVHSLRKVLVMADRLLSIVESDSFIEPQYKERMRNEIDKAMSFTLNDKAAEQVRVADGAWVCERCGHNATSQYCSNCNLPFPPRR